MGSHFLLRSASIAALFSSATIAQAETVFPADALTNDQLTQVPPMGGWNVDYGEKKCRLVRIFGTEEDPYFLSFEQAAPGPFFGLVIAGSELKRYRSARSLEIGLQNDVALRDLGYFYRGDVETFGPAVIKSSFGLRNEASSYESAIGISVDEAAKIDRIVLRRGKRTLSLETGNMRAPFEALNTCTIDLLGSWGLDPEKHRSFTPATWTNQVFVAKKLQENYPVQARRRGEQAIFRFHVIVEADGSVSKCEQVESTETRLLETPACQEMMRRATFAPALDADGAPMRSFYSTTISYRL
jgi:hypothetical protein